MPALQETYERHGSTTEFFLVYIREAHPSDAWQIKSNERDDVIFASPRDMPERCSIAQTCAAELEITFPALVDEIDNATDEAYTGWPERIYLIGADGRIRYKSGPGPFGFEPAELDTALEQLALEAAPQ